MTPLTPTQIDQVEHVVQKLIQLQMRNDDRTFNQAMGHALPLEEPSLDILAPALVLLKLFEKQGVEAPSLRKFLHKPSPQFKDAIAELRSIEDKHENLVNDGSS